MFTALHTKVNCWKDLGWELVQLCPESTLAILSRCATVCSMFLSNVKYKLHSYWPERILRYLLMKVQLNALGRIRLVIMLRDWLAFIFFSDEGGGR